MFEAIGIEKSYENRVALGGVDLHVPKGSVYGLLGPNGAGKSTLLRCLVGAYAPRKGKVLLDGQPVWENPAVKQRIAYIPDDMSAYPGSSVKEMAAMFRLLYPRFDEARFRELQEVFSFKPQASFRKMSKGMQKQAAFWLALSTGAEVLVLDEPMDGLDPVIRRRIWQILMEDVAARGTTVLISSHNLRELEDVCDVVGILDKGKMLLERSLAELQEGTVKVQLVPGAEDLPLETIYRTQGGRLQTWIVKGEEASVRAVLEDANLSFYEILPMSLEEIFLYEVGGISQSVKRIFTEG